MRGAKYNLGMIYHGGLGIPQDYKQTARLGNQSGQAGSCGSTV